MESYWDEEETLKQQEDAEISTTVHFNPYIQDLLVLDCMLFPLYNTIIAENVPILWFGKLYNTKYITST